MDDRFQTVLTAPSLRVPNCQIQRMPPALAAKSYVPTAHQGTSTSHGVGHYTSVRSGREPNQRSLNWPKSSHNNRPKPSVRCDKEPNPSSPWATKLHRNLPIAPNCRCCPTLRHHKCLCSHNCRSGCATGPCPAVRSNYRTHLFVKHQQFEIRDPIFHRAQSSCGQTAGAAFHEEKALPLLQIVL